MMKQNNINKEELKDAQTGRRTYLLVGIQALATYLGVSYSSAWRIVSSGRIDHATFQPTPRCYVFDPEKVLEALCVANQNPTDRKFKYNKV